jgi:hypothetical protein
MYYKTNHIYQFGSSPHPVHFMWLQLSKCDTINLTCRQLLFLFLHQLRVPLHVTYNFTLMYQPCYCLLFQSLTWHHTSLRHWWICFTRKFISLLVPVLLCVCKKMVSAITLYAWGCSPYRCWCENFIWRCIICIFECDKFCCIWVLCDRLQYKHSHVHENKLRMHFLKYCQMQHNDERMLLREGGIEYLALCVCHSQWTKFLMLSWHWSSGSSLL